jgi:hypothetical protein
MPASHGLCFDESRFWVIHRRRRYGPFDYEWSADLYGLELTYQGLKFGEICSREEIYADLSEFRLPRRVVQVASLVSGCLLFGMLHGFSPLERIELLEQHLTQHGCADFLYFEST